MATNDGLYVQYGCGFSSSASWRNFDSSPTLRFERIALIGHLYTKNRQRFPANVEYGDIVKGLPLAADSCDAIYCSHVLEHLSFTDFDIALDRSRSYLRKGKPFRLVVPDLETLAMRYASDSADGAAEAFMRESGLGLVDRPQGLIGFLKTWLGAREHLWMWDYKALAAQLRHHGFVDIRRAQFGDSEEPRFADVEHSERFEAAVAVQCRKE
ncbi:MAG: methyltransferase type 11 [Betaproteobacteria bacterium]|nr:methyltransferase type 11 [Betaproteobacteria bacterium]